MKFGHVSNGPFLVLFVSTQAIKRALFCISALSNTWLGYKFFFCVEIYALDHCWSYIVIWATTNFALLIFYIIITFLGAMIPSCYFLLARQMVHEGFALYLAS